MTDNAERVAPIEPSDYFVLRVLESRRGHKVTLKVLMREAEMTGAEVFGAMDRLYAAGLIDKQGRVPLIDGSG